MATLDTLHLGIIHTVRNCPPPAVDRAILDAARYLCREARCVHEVIVMNVVKDPRFYELVSADSNMEVIGVKAAQVGTFDPLGFASFEEVPQTSGTPVAAIIEQPNQLWLSPTPNFDATSGLAARVEIQPKLSATALPQSLLQRWQQDVELGAVSYLLGQKGAGWYEPNLAADRMAEFIRRVWMAREESDRAYRPRGFRTAPVAWGTRWQGG